MGIVQVVKSFVRILTVERRMEPSALQTEASTLSVSVLIFTDEVTKMLKSSLVNSQVCTACMASGCGQGPGAFQQIFLRI